MEYIKESRKTRYHTYDIIYLAFHGTKNEIQISKNNAISLEEFAESCPNWFEGKYVHFSSCSVGKSMSLKEFKKITGAYAVSSFTKEIPFFFIFVFDLVLLQKLTQYEKIGYLDKYFNDNFEYLYNKLGFVLLK